MKSFNDKVCVVTGSSMGIGRELANQLLGAGAKVIINGTNASRLQKTLDSLQAHGDYSDQVSMCVADVSNIEDSNRLIRHALNRHGRLDVLINNAGLSMEGELEEIQPSVIQRLMDVNLVGPAQTTKVALPLLRETGGSVIFVSSLAGLYGLPSFSPYSCSKMALTSLAESLRNELYGSGVHVGIAYLSFTENDPEKTIYDANGNVVPLPKRTVMRAEPVELVASQILQMVEQRTFKRVFSPMGKLIAFASRYCPSLFGLLVRLRYRKYRDSLNSDSIDNLEHGIG